MARIKCGPLLSASLKLKFSGGVGFRLVGDFHAVGQVDEDDLIAHGGLASGAVGDGARERLRSGERRNCKNDGCEKLCELLQCHSFEICDGY